MRKPQHTDRHVLRVLLGLARPRPRTAAGPRRVRNARLRRLLRHAARHSPYYREVFARAGLRERDLGSADVLAALPVLDRNIIRDRPRELMSEGVRYADCIQRVTAGTTGAPLRIPTTPFEELMDAALWTRGYLERGVRPWHRQAKITLPVHLGRRRRFLQRAGMFRRFYCSMADPPATKIAWLRRLRPAALFCWGSVLGELAACLEEQDAQLRIPLVFTTSDTLWPDVRLRAQRRLHARVVDMYGSVEAGPIGWECPEGHGFHVDEALVVVELLDDDGRPARSGRVVCTPLWRYACPLIRVPLGDYAEWSESACSCGSPWACLTRLRGRETSLLDLPPHHRSLHPTLLFEGIGLVPGVRQFQFVQTGAREFVLRIVRGPEFAEDALGGIERYYARVFGNALSVRPVFRNAIRMPAGMKAAVLVTSQALTAARARGIDVSPLLATE